MAGTLLSGFAAPSSGAPDEMLLKPLRDPLGVGFGEFDAEVGAAQFLRHRQRHAATGEGV